MRSNGFKIWIMYMKETDLIDKATIEFHNWFMQSNAPAYLIEPLKMAFLEGYKRGNMAKAKKKAPAKKGKK